jgi:hypothetical protein
MTEAEPTDRLSEELMARVRAESAPILQRRLMRRMRSALSTVPAIYIPLRRRRRADTVAGPGTEFILEGYPRCGNTWAEMAIRHAATRPLKMAHHSHAAAHVSYGLGLGIPTLVLFREPDQAVRSLLAMKARNLTAADAYREYIRFYETVLTLPRDHLMFASFEDVTSRIDRVITALNARFGLPLVPFDPEDKAQKAAVFARMDARAAVIRTDGQAVSRSNPNHFDAEQLALKRLAQEQIAAVRDGGLYRVAHATYAA